MTERVTIDKSDTYLYRHYVVGVGVGMMGGEGAG